MQAFNELLRDVKANLLKLDSCPKHVFRVNERWDFGAPKTFVCDQCGGTVRTDFAYAYARGYLAHGGAFKDIFPELDENVLQRRKQV